MNVNDLPIEVLQNIFKDFTVDDILNCRGICQRWQQAVDGLSDEFWKGICKEDFSYLSEDKLYSEVYEEAYRKSNLSWRELYMTLRLWPKVETADFQVLRLPNTNVINFQLLAHGVIGLPCSENNNNSGLQQYDTIIYYDLTTMQELHKTGFDVPFTDYAENDKLILVRNVDKSIDATIKVNKKRFSFKKHEESKFLWKLLENMFYYQTFNKLYCVKLVQHNGEASLDSIEITANIMNSNWRYTDEILNIEDIAYIDSEQVNIRTGNHKIFSVIDNEMKLIYFYHNSISLDMIREYGFKWSANDISCHLEVEEYFAGPPEERTDFSTDVEAVSSFDKIVIIAIASPLRKLVIYYNPLRLNSETPFYYAIPDITVDLDAYGIGDAHHNTSVTQIDVLEVVNGHSVIVLCSGVVYVIDLNHDGRKSEPLYREIKTSKLKSSKSKCILI